MTPIETAEIRKLFKLAELSQEVEFVDFKTVDHFNKLREQHGLSKLLVLIQQYAEYQAELPTKTHQTQYALQDSNVVQ